MKTTFKIVLFYCITVVLFNGCAKQNRQGLTLVDGQLSVGVEVGYPPMEYFDIDGKTLIGFDIELVKELAKKLGFEAKFIDTAWEGIMAGLDTGKYDIAINVTILPERQKKYNFTEPYIASTITMAALKTSPLNIAGPENIAGLNVAFQGDTTAQYFTEKLLERGVTFLPFSYDKIINCFDDLLLGRVDLVVTDNLVAYDYAGKESSPFKVVWQEPSDELIGICLKKGNDALTVALNKALDELFADGTLLRISRKIFNSDLVSSVR